ncbi:MAG TPA: TetR family transcriptional regulator C-terminal domain-containing protein [Gemmatimonadaceae bacterium]|nr:TetR family transcriptional regulator C-terminal domain-containing protein [Gemmatimonadaceae bacterium]
MPGPKQPEEERRDAILRAAYRIAARERLGGVTARAVAAEARVSSGLVFFYFESIDNLLVALLDWLLDRTIARAQRGGVIDALDVEDPAKRLTETVALAVRRLPRERERVELFFDYWVLGTRHPVIRRKIRRALALYRESFVAEAQTAIDAHPGRYAHTSAEGLADLIASFLYGCALQIVTDPTRFDTERTLATLDALVRQPVPA